MPLIRKNEAVWVEARKRWQINVQLNGKRRTFTSSREGRKGKIEAERKADDWLESGASDNPRSGDLWCHYLESIKDTTSTGNYRNHESIGRLWLLPVLEHRHISDITMQDMQACVNEGAKKGLSRKSCSNIRASLTAFYTYARKCRVAMERPDMISVPKSAPKGERRILQPDELTAGKILCKREGTWQ